jgi:hypothetical protein
MRVPHDLAHLLLLARNAGTVPAAHPLHERLLAGSTRDAAARHEVVLIMRGAPTRVVGR